MSRYSKKHYEDVAEILSEHGGYVTARVVTDDIVRAFADLFAADNPPTCLEHTDASAYPIDAQHHASSDHVDVKGEPSPEDCQCIEGGGRFGGFDREQFLTACGLRLKETHLPGNILGREY